MMLDCWQCCGAPRRGPHKYECIYSGPVTTSATPRRHDHRCPGCGDRIDCDYVCCEKCIPNRVVTGCPDCATLRARVAELEAQLATARAEERERLRDAIESLRKAMSMRHSTDGWPPPLSMSERVALHRLENMVKSPCLTPEPRHD